MIYSIKTFLSVLAFATCGGEGVHQKHENKARGVDYDYRIADTVKALYYGPYGKMREKMPAHYPGSIASMYVNESRAICSQNPPGYPTKQEALSRRQVCYNDKIAALDRVLQNACPHDADSLRGTVVHLRLGDSFCATTDYAVEALRPPRAFEVAQVVASHRVAEEPCVVVYSSHGGCEADTRAYVDRVKVVLSESSGSSSRHENSEMKFESVRVRLEEGVGWQDADRHFCAMVGARVFIQGAGGFSYLAERVRTLRGLSTVNSLVRVEIVWLDAAKEAKKHESDKGRRGSFGNVESSVAKQNERGVLLQRNSSTRANRRRRRDREP